jgi:hypothetical protein
MRRPATSQLLRFACFAVLALGVTHAQPSPAQGSAAGAAAAYPKGPGSLEGVWVNTAYLSTARYSARERAIRTSDGGPPPLLPSAAALLEKRLTDDMDRSQVFANTVSQCLPGGVPEMMFGSILYPVQFLENAGQVTVLFEEQNHFRIIFLNATHPKDLDPGFMGHSVGHWEGDTLVVDTIGFNDRTTIDMVGTPHTEALHVVERIRRIAKDQLEVKVRLEDPGAFSKPWETKVIYKSAPAERQHLEEYICENNRNMADANGHTTFGRATGN